MRNLMAGDGPPLAVSALGIDSAVAPGRLTG
jgi:hypothetical protein